jgi:hypothetical protein
MAPLWEAAVNTGLPEMDNETLPVPVISKVSWVAPAIADMEKTNITAVNEQTIDLNPFFIYCLPSKLVMKTADFQCAKIVALLSYFVINSLYKLFP